MDHRCYRAVSLTRRWFDKSFSLLMSRNGYTAVSFEHAWGDGVAVMRFFNEVFRDTTDRPLLPRPSSSSSGGGGGGAPPTEEGITRLGFELSGGVRAAVEQARAEVGESTGSLSVSSMEYQGLGKTEVKKHGLSPDAVMQVAFQVHAHAHACHIIYMYMHVLNVL